MHAQGKVRAQKRTEKIFTLYLRLVLGIETVCNNPKYKNNDENQRTLGKGEKLTSRVTTGLDANVQLSTKKSQGIQRNRKIWHIWSKK